MGHSRLFYRTGVIGRCLKEWVTERGCVQNWSFLLQLPHSTHSVITRENTWSAHRTVKIHQSWSTEDGNTAKGKSSPVESFNSTDEDNWAIIIPTVHFGVSARAGWSQCWVYVWLGANSRATSSCFIICAQSNRTELHRAVGRKQKALVGARLAF